MKKKVVILGGLSKRRYFKRDRNAEHWMINGQQVGRIGQLVKPDRVFNLHRLALLKRYKYDFMPEMRWVATDDNKHIPFTTIDPWFKKGVLAKIKSKFTWPGWNALPVARMAKDMPRGRYHCGTFDWLVAYAIYLGFTEIEFHGVGLCLEAGEPISARACLEYWCGYAEGRGIKITTAPDCDFFHFYHLVKSRLTYGLDDTPIFEDRTKRGVPYDYKG